MGVVVQWLNQQNAQFKARSLEIQRAREAAEVARDTLEAEGTRLTELRAPDSEELATLRELCNDVTNLSEDLQAVRADMRRLGFEFSDEKRASAAEETRAANVPTPSSRSGAALSRLKTEFAECQGRVCRLTAELANEKKKVNVSYNCCASNACGYE